MYTIINEVKAVEAAKAAKAAKATDFKRQREEVRTVTLLVPEHYRIKVPKLVWESRNVTWHGYSYLTVIRSLKESLCDGLYEVAINHMTELLASGYSSEFWDSLWETFFMQGLVIVEPSLASFYLNEYRFLHSLKSKIEKYGFAVNLVNSQVYRNHLAELITIFNIFEHRALPNELLYDGADLIMEPIKDNISRSLSQEYVLMSKTDENTCVQLEELHYNLAKFLEAVRTSSSEIPESVLEGCKVEPNYAKTFFWIHEIVKMADVQLKPDLQNYLPRHTEEWTCHPSNILWNYLFIRAPNKIWGLLGTLMEIYTINFKRKQSLTCSAILQNVLIMINDDEFLDRYRSQTYLRSRHPLVIQTVMKINNLMSKV